MKKKILSLTAVVLTMAMTTTSVFAVVPKGTGDVDGDKNLTPNDAVEILKGTDSTEADYSGKGNTDASNAQLIMQAILRPRYVKEAYQLRVTTLGENSIFADGISVFAETAFNGTALDPKTTKGMTVMDGTDKYNPDPTIAEAVKALADQASLKTEAINNSLNNIKFYSADIGRDVTLSSEEGWAMFCWAVQPIVTAEASDLDAYNKIASPSKQKEATPAADVKADRIGALRKVKDALNVGSGKIDVTAAEVPEIANNLLAAFPDTITEAEVNAAAERILFITDKKYDFSVSYKDAADEAITATSPFVQKVAKFAPNYQGKKMSEVVAEFGDSVTVKSHLQGTAADNIKGATFQIKNTAAYAE